MDRNREIGNKPKSKHTIHCKGGTTDQWGKDELHIEWYKEIIIHVEKKILNS